MATNTGQMGFLPSGGAIFCIIPDILYLPELIFGGLTLSLVASTYLLPYNPQAYVITVTIFCFLTTFLWMMVFFCGSHHNKGSWATADVAYHGFATVLYLSASVLLALVTIGWTQLDNMFFLFYQLDIAAVVFSFLTTLLYLTHTVFSALRWKTY
ncbi:mal, T cell differentiation protein a, tandem duplicate 1 [Danio aesculapii]|uniref:mal, T cell differentiation protein a, tandem duplicate 1 n=1 Tax=Danio aesculapii TaxID=1142201 RepID=UPI0024C034AB|nr:mal, T cell differentiation protein a, tandem duplicate 1 [Danio aesculapii]